MGLDIEGNSEAREIANFLNLETMGKTLEESLDCELGPPPKISIEEASNLELKFVSLHLRYAYLGTY